MKLPVKNSQREELVKREQKNKIQKIADKMCKLLIAEGFIVQRYDAYSTNSIYLKIDYGVCNSIRISDHKGKEYLNYMYNLRSDIKKYYKEKTNFTRYYYPFEQRGRLIEHIKYNKQKKIDKYGNIKVYNELMNIEKNLKSNNKGFWKEAYLANEGEIKK